MSDSNKQLEKDAAAPRVQSDVGQRVDGNMLLWGAAGAVVIAFQIAAELQNVVAATVFLGAAWVLIVVWLALK